MFVILLISCTNKYEIDTVALGRDVIFYRDYNSLRIVTLSKDKDYFVGETKELLNIALILDTVLFDIIISSGGVTANKGMTNPEMLGKNISAILLKHQLDYKIENYLDRIYKYPKDNAIYYLTEEIRKVILSEQSLLDKNKSETLLVSQVLLNLETLQSYILLVIVQQCNLLQHK